MIALNISKLSMTICWRTYRYGWKYHEGEHLLQPSIASTHRANVLEEPCSGQCVPNFNLVILWAIALWNNSITSWDNDTWVQRLGEEEFVVERIGHLLEGLGDRIIIAARAEGREEVGTDDTALRPDEVEAGFGCVVLPSWEKKKADTCEHQVGFTSRSCMLCLLCWIIAGAPPTPTLAMRSNGLAVLAKPPSHGRRSLCEMDASNWTTTPGFALLNGYWHRLVPDLIGPQRANTDLRHKCFQAIATCWNSQHVVVVAQHVCIGKILWLQRSALWLFRSLVCETDKHLGPLFNFFNCILEDLAIPITWSSTPLWHDLTCFHWPKKRTRIKIRFPELPNLKSITQFLDDEGSRESTSGQTENMLGPVGKNYRPTWIEFFEILVVRPTTYHLLPTVYYILLATYYLLASTYKLIAINY